MREKMLDMVCKSLMYFIFPWQIKQNDDKKAEKDSQHVVQDGGELHPRPTMLPLVSRDKICNTLNLNFIWKYKIGQINEKEGAKEHDGPHPCPPALQLADGCMMRSTHDTGLRRTLKIKEKDESPHVQIHACPAILPRASTRTYHHNCVHLSFTVKVLMCFYKDNDAFASPKDECMLVRIIDVHACLND